MEIERLHNMLIEAGIDHLWLDRAPKYAQLLYSRTPDFEPKNWSYQIRLLVEEPFFSAIEGFGSYGYGLNGEQGDHIEIMIGDDVQGWLKAEQVLEIIKEILNV